MGEIKLRGHEIRIIDGRIITNGAKFRFQYRLSSYPTEWKDCACEYDSKELAQKALDAQRKDDAAYASKWRTC